MTDKEKQGIRQQLHAVVDAAAENMIAAIEKIDSMLPEGVTKEQRDMVITNTINLSRETVSMSINEMAKNMNRDDLIKKAMEAVNVG